MVDISKFAERTERLCDFILSQLTEDGRDRRAIQDLKEDAADIQTILKQGNVELETALQGVGELIGR